MNYIKDMKLTGNCNMKWYNNGIYKKSEQYDLGSWHGRKDIHDFIIDEFSKKSEIINENSEDFKEIDLSVEALTKVLKAVSEGNLPKGDFYETISPTQKKQDIFLLQRAINWLSEKDDQAYRSLNYRAFL